MLSDAGDFCDYFTYIRHAYVPETESIVWLTQCQWRKQKYASEVIMRNMIHNVQY